METALTLGARIDPATHERLSDPLTLDRRDLTTHGVIVGMTGSGKTGLGIVLLEEAISSGVPVVALDPKGDLTNLLLTFPGLDADSFRGWVPPDQDPVEVARTWKEGLAGWGIGPERVQAFAARIAPTIFTPGSTAGVSINIVGSLAPPVGLDGEARNDEIEGFVSGLLGLVGIEADPLVSREHILLANLVDRAWSEGRSIDLARLIGEVQSPPLRKLGVIELDAFFPPDDRRQLAQRLNGLLASPGFAPWSQGSAFDLDELLSTPVTSGEAGPPRVPVLIVELAHLSDEARQLALTLVMTKLVTWMRRQPGTDDLRLLIYLDEAFGFLPPVAAPPSKKPILTVLKQARAFGVGMVIATQNPVDLDYKALSNAGTWMVGRLQTDRDKDRLLDGMQTVAGDTDLGELGQTITGLGKREFLHHSVKGGPPGVFTSRWAMSYLRGPLTLAQIQTLTASAGGQQVEPTEPSPTPEGEGGPAASVAAPSLEGDDEVPVAPEIAAGIPVSFLDPAASWAGAVGAVGGETRVEAGLAARVRIRFDDRAAGLDVTDEWEAIYLPIPDPFDPRAARMVDYDERDFVAGAPVNARFVLPTAPLASGKWFDQAKATLRDHLAATEAVTVYRNKVLKLVSRVGENREAFVARCHATAEEEEDREADVLRRKLTARIDRVRDAMEAAQERARAAEADQRSRMDETIVESAGSLLDVFMRGRKSARSLATGLRRGMSRRSQSARSAERAKAAERRVLDKLDEVHDLEQALAAALVDLDEHWREQAELIDELRIGPEKTDVAVEQLTVVWVPRPTSSDASRVAPMP